LTCCFPFAALLVLLPFIVATRRRTEEAPDYVAPVTLPLGQYVQTKGPHGHDLWLLPADGSPPVLVARVRQAGG
jgi:hypothetical protein